MAPKAAGANNKVPAATSDWLKGELSKGKSQSNFRSAVELAASEEAKKVDVENHWAAELESIEKDELSNLNKVITRNEAGAQGGRVARGTVRFGFEKDKVKSSEFRREGRQTFYTAGNIDKRRALRNDPVVLDYLGRFYRLFGSDPISKEHMIEFEVICCKVLFDPEEWDEVRDADHSRKRHCI